MQVFFITCPLIYIEQDLPDLYRGRRGLPGGQHTLQALLGGVSVFTALWLKWSFLLFPSFITFWWRKRVIILIFFPSGKVKLPLAYLKYFREHFSFKNDLSFRLSVLLTIWLSGFLRPFIFLIAQLTQILNERQYFFLFSDHFLI